MTLKSDQNTAQEERELFLYAQDRIKQKKRLNQHLIFFLVGCVFIIILSQVSTNEQNFFLRNWVWVILAWAFIFIVHLINVFITNRFMGKKWESEQLLKLREKQRKRLIELQHRVDSEARTKTPYQDFDPSL